METWRTVWRAVAPLLPTAGLEALAQALADDDSRLVQGRTVVGRSPLMTAADFAHRRDTPIHGACPVGYCGWQADLLMSVGEVADYFQRVSEAADKALAEPGVLCHFTARWWDCHDRGHVFRELLPEVQRELTLRQCEQRTS
jgi:hypothetical protein